ncbi:MAG: BrnT family toxin [Candidatus Omnitrophica bacterium]|nr:BrnT family toxin [Candidatus Omnitrophota bacterium]
MDIYYQWDNEKNELLKQKRDICFEQVVMRINKGDLLDIIENPNCDKYPDQRILIININGYVWLVPFVQEQQNVYFLKTIIPSRKATKRYLRGEK